MNNDEIDQILEGADADRRSFLKRVAFGAAFAAPVVTTFSMTGFGAGAPSAFGANTSGLGGNTHGSNTEVIEYKPPHGSNV